MNPAKSILDRVGVQRAAEVTGKHISRIYRWTYPASKGGTNGIVPHDDAIKLLEYARAEGVPLDETDFMQAPSQAPEDNNATVEAGSVEEPKEEPALCPPNETEPAR